MLNALIRLVSMAITLPGILMKPICTTLMRCVMTCPNRLKKKVTLLLSYIMTFKLHSHRTNFKRLIPAEISRNQQLFAV
jgi:hypothetical protein